MKLRQLASQTYIRATLNLIFVSALLLISAGLGCARSSQPHRGEERNSLTIELPHSIITAPNSYTWTRQEFGGGSVQQAQLPSGRVLQLQRLKATNLSAIVSQPDLHSLQIFAMELASPAELPPTGELLSAFSSQPFTYQGMKPLQEDRGTVNYAGARCARVAGKVEVNGSAKFKEVPFDFQIVQLDCISPKISDRVFRLSISERARRGTNFVSDDVEREMLATLAFR